MASNVQMLVFRGAPEPAATPAQASVVALAGGLRAIPVSGRLLQAICGDSAGGEPLRPGWMLKACVMPLAQRLSVDRWVLYLASESFGATRAKEAAGWNYGEVRYGPTGTCEQVADLEDGYQVTEPANSAINAALRLMGVRGAGNLDEFAVAGLDAHRFTADWLAG